MKPPLQLIYVNNMLKNKITKYKKEQICYKKTHYHQKERNRGGEREKERREGRKDGRKEGERKRKEERKKERKESCCLSNVSSASVESYGF
jgi:hypothetical protein